jgi:hypothetical protein
MKHLNFFTPFIVFCFACDALEGPPGPQGKQGPTGAAGSTSLIKITTEVAGSNCAAGGVKIETGVDDNNNRILETTEVDNTTYVCNGIKGLSAPGSLVKVTAEAVGSHCVNGGAKIDIGIDDNQNQLLELSEIDNSVYVCNGYNGANSLVKVTAEPSGTNCAAGGVKIQSGIDANKNLVLDASEIIDTNYVCNSASATTPSTTPTYTLSVNGQTNCVLLNSSPAAFKSISSGSFLFNVTGNAYFSPGASHKNVFIRYSGSDDDHLAMLAIGGTKALGLRSGKMYAFFADWDDINDNSGDAIITYGANSLTVNGKTNCIFLDDSPAARMVIPAGTYKVKVTGDAYFSLGATHYDVLVRYAGTTDDMLDILPIGGEKTISLRTGYGFYAFFADWDNLGDNSGTVTLEFYKQ